MNPRFYIYRHVRHDTNEVFYIGKGSFRKKRPQKHPERAFAPKNNDFWRRVVAKCKGYDVEIVMLLHTDQEAQQKEKELIALYGRRDRHRGTLVNLTDGGEGSCGIIPSAETIRLRSISSSRPRGPKWIEACRKARKNGGNGGVVKHGDKLPDWWKKKISDARLKTNWMRGRTGELHHNSRRVINLITGHIHASVKIASETSGFNMKTLYNMLSGHRENRSVFSFV